MRKPASWRFRRSAPRLRYYLRCLRRRPHWRPARNRWREWSSPTATLPRPRSGPWRSNVRRLRRRPWVRRRRRRRPRRRLCPGAGRRLRKLLVLRRRPSPKVRPKRPVVEPVHGVHPVRHVQGSMGEDQEQGEEREQGQESGQGRHHVLPVPIVLRLAEGRREESVPRRPEQGQGQVRDSLHAARGGSRGRLGHQGEEEGRL
mmetsp:Transcript_13751/g.25811  ORF Transcript_13751/g.25811 Transcript_13751/m.25811 type:complete len:202 (-) Transcript_13751:410-1015(-)